MIIEKNMPIPQKDIRKEKYPLDSMDVGDSFFIQSDKKDIAKMRNSVSSATTYKAFKTEMKFCVRSVEGGVRVWRTV